MCNYFDYGSFTHRRYLWPIRVLEGAGGCTTKQIAKVLGDGNCDNKPPSEVI